MASTLEPAVDGQPESNGRYFVAMTAGYPIAWALGLGPAVFMIAALPMAVWLLRNRPLRLPPGSLLYGVFLLIVVASAVQVSSAGKAAVYLMRTLWYASGFLALLYLSRQRGPEVRRKVIRGMVLLWGLIALGGYGAILLPTLAWPGPVGLFLPGAIAGDEFVADLINPRVAEIQEFPWEDVTLYRPAAPFSYTNAWGSSFALLFPFLLAAFQDRRIGFSRPAVVALMMFGLPPFYFALNRGAWLTLSLGLLYGTVRWAWVSRNLLPIKVLGAMIAIGLPLVVVSGVMNTALSQLETRSEDSNETRANIYVETLEASLGSPMIGYAGPNTNPANPDGPPLGTHGQLWAIMYAHGFVALGAYLVFFARGLLFSRGSGPVAHWAKVSLLIGAMQIPIYGHLPLQIFVMIGCTIIASWPHVLDSERAPTPSVSGLDPDAVQAACGVAR